MPDLETLRRRLLTLSDELPELRVDAEAVHATLSSTAAEDPVSDRDLETAAIVTACLAGDPRAQALFEARYFSAVRPTLRAMGLDDAAIHDIEQRVRLKLLVAPSGEAAPVLGYLGKGDLRAFVRVVATRLAVSDRRKVRPRAPESALEQVAHGADPQLRYLEAAEARAFAEALEAATEALAVEERVLLRLHHVDALTVDEIGALHGVHRATAARRIVRARGRLLALVREELKRSLGLGSAELDSLLRDARSELDVSLSRLLRA
ncbi:MAG: sigma-70 family RNA polymerase sigma factor [Myxococcales bacterium]|nr:sigma-70 family RNA polymerase sigma factor [Myxococcales bacterium]